MNTVNETKRQYWLWVTRPEFYLDDEGKDRADLDPTEGGDAGGWWTCHKDTRRGDLVFLWRTRPRSDIGYLFQAESDAYSLRDDEYAAQRGWDYGCDYRVLYKFKNPVTIQDLRNEPGFQDWKPLRGQFQRRVFRILPEYWTALNQLAAKKNPDYRKLIETFGSDAAGKSITREKQLEEMLVNDLGLLKRFGYDLALYIDPETGADGQQFACEGGGGRIDLLCYDRRRKRYVVIELKNDRAGYRTFGQICSYMGWVKAHIAKKTPVEGLVISRGYDARFESAMNVVDQISQLDIEQLGFE